MDFQINIVLCVEDQMVIVIVILNDQCEVYVLFGVNDVNLCCMCELMWVKLIVWGEIVIIIGDVVDVEGVECMVCDVLDVVCLGGEFIFDSLLCLVCLSSEGCSFVVEIQVNGLILLCGFKFKMLG